MDVPQRGYWQGRLYPITRTRYGETLGVGGYLSDLERTRVGEYRKEEAVELEELRNR